MDNINIIIKLLTMSKLNNQINQLILNHINTNNLNQSQINQLINNQIDSLINLNNDLNN